MEDICKIFWLSLVEERKHSFCIISPSLGRKKPFKMEKNLEVDFSPTTSLQNQLLKINTLLQCIVAKTHGLYSFI